MLAEIRSLRPSVYGGQVDRTALGSKTRVKPGKGGGSSPDWADPIVYDKEKSYKKGEMVVIRPTDSIVVTGALDTQSGVIKKGVAGVWKATQDTSPTQPLPPEERLPFDPTETTYNVPQWPLRSPDDPDGTENYWFPISFYPQTVIDCDFVEGGVSTWTNASKKPS